MHLFSMTYIFPTIKAPESLNKFKGKQKMESQMSIVADSLEHISKMPFLGLNVYINTSF